MVEEGVGGGGALGKKSLTLAESVDGAGMTSGGGVGLECAVTATNSSGGRLYPCPDCEKVFRHPRSYYQHQHVHRGTHSCPGCGKLFSRRWDLLRHLNKNKYGCPARWRDGGNRHPPPPPYRNSLSLSALAAAAAASSPEGMDTTTPLEDHHDHVVSSQPPLHQPVSWTIPTITVTTNSSTAEGGGVAISEGGATASFQHSSNSSSGSNGEPRPPESPTASRTSP